MDESIIGLLMGLVIAVVAGLGFYRGARAGYKEAKELEENVGRRYVMMRPLIWFGLGWLVLGIVFSVAAGEFLFIPKGVTSIVGGLLLAGFYAGFGMVLLLPFEKLYVRRKRKKK